MINYFSSKNLISNFKILIFASFLFFFDLGIRSFEFQGYKLVNIDLRWILLLIIPFFWRVVRKKK